MQDLRTMKVPANAQQKIWGETWPLFEDDHLLVMRLLAVAGGYCSEHYHRSRNNLFIVHSGVLLVRVETRYQQWDTFTIKGGQSLLVPVGTVHQFEARTVVLCDEVYHPLRGTKIDVQDIVRRTQGGRR